MMRYQNDSMSAPAGRALPADRRNWVGEISNGRENDMPYSGPVVLEAAPERTMARSGAIAPIGQTPVPNGLTGSGAQMPAAGGQLQMQNNLPSEVIEAPTTVGEAYLGSLKAMLAKNVGNYIVATFLVGTQNMVSWEGILYDVGNDYLTIYQENRDRYIVSDYYSLKFMEFYDEECRRLCASRRGEDGRRLIRN